MVKTDNILSAFENDDILIREIDLINELTKQYPFFQQTWALKTKYLKIKNTYSSDNLQQAAARTIDRSVLFDILEKTSGKKKARKLKENIATQKNKQVIVEKQEVYEDSEQVDDTSQEQEILENYTEEVVEIQPEQDEVKKQKVSIIPKQQEKKPEKLHFTDWLRQYQYNPKQKPEQPEDFIDKFLKERPKIVPKKDISFPPPDIIKKSVTEKQMLMTETLANLYVKQKKYNKAIQAFRILSLKYPKKSSYFANQIKELKKHLK